MTKDKLNSIETNFLAFVHNIALTKSADKNMVAILLVGFNFFDYEQLAEALKIVTEQAYNGLNRETGEWCKELLKAAIDAQFE